MRRPACTGYHRNSAAQGKLLVVWRCILSVRNIRGIPAYRNTAPLFQRKRYSREIGGLRQFHSLSVFPALIVEHIEIEPVVCIAESYALESLNSDRSVPSCRLVTESQQTCVYLLECFVNYAVAVSSAVRKLDIASELRSGLDRLKIELSCVLRHLVVQPYAVADRYGVFSGADCVVGQHFAHLAAAVLDSSEKLSGSILVNAVTDHSGN